MKYLDHAATTPMRQVAIDAWVEHAGALNPGAQHAAGRQANAVLADAREQVAELLGADPVEVIFTGSGTEADNIAVRGLYEAMRGKQGERVVCSPVEHSAVLETVKALGAQHVDWLPVGDDGHLSDLEALDTPAAVAAVMWANNETGALQPVKEVVRRAALQNTPVHVDAVQAVGKVPVHFHDLGATTLAASAHKFGGPRGTGLLLAKRSPAPTASIHGGGQERGLRPGTVDVASAAATAAALAEACSEMERERERVKELRDALVAGVQREVPDVVVTTQEPAVEGHAHFMFRGAHGDAMLMLLDSLGIAVSTGSTCASGVTRMSHVLEAMGVEEVLGLGALRISLGRTNTREDVDYFVQNIADVVAKARAAGNM